MVNQTSDIHPSRANQLAQDDAAMERDPLIDGPPAPVFTQTNSNASPLGHRRSRTDDMETQVNSTDPTKYLLGESSSMKSAETITGFQRQEPRSFGSGEPLRAQGEAQGFRSIANTHDRDLLDYLAKRQVSEGFLVEIDLFLREHPEILDYCVPWVEHFNSLPPLQSYKSFLAGYTKPARYCEGVLPEGAFTITVDFVPRRLEFTFDEELTELFGEEYRHDLLRSLDEEVARICRLVQLGVRQVSREQRLLISYAIFGNPVDAYKFWQFNYQTDDLALRYHPEHAILKKVAEAVVGPPPSSSITGPGFIHDVNPNGQCKYRGTRIRMARANDQGADAVDVLLGDYTRELVKKGLKRVQIEALVRQAREAIKAEGENPTGTDIVDRVMDIAAATPRVVSDKPRVVPNKPHTALKQLNSKYHRPTVTMPTVPSFTNPVADILAKGRRQKTTNALREAERVLRRLYLQESDAMQNGLPDELNQIVSARRDAESKYVMGIVPYLLENGRMTKHIAGQLRKTYGKKRALTPHEEFARRDYLLGLFPPDLK